MSEVTINSRKYDESIRRTWKGGLLTQNDSLVVLVGSFEQDVVHDDLGQISEGTVSFEYYWLDRWYNIFRFLEPDGSLRNYYCNIAMPASLANGVLDFVDLDIDVVVWPDGRREILDMDDFENNSAKYSYPEEVRNAARRSLNEVLDLIERQEFPFDHATKI